MSEQKTGWMGTANSLSMVKRIIAAIIAWLKSQVEDW